MSIFCLRTIKYLKNMIRLNKRIVVRDKSSKIRKDLEKKVLWTETQIWKSTTRPD